MLEGLAAAGLVERQRSDRDRRVVLTSLTDDGRGLVEERRARFEPRFRAALEGFSEDELVVAAAVLDRLRDLFEESPRSDASSDQRSHSRRARRLAPARARSRSAPRAGDQRGVLLVGPAPAAPGRPASRRRSRRSRRAGPRDRAARGACRRGCGSGRRAHSSATSARRRWRGSRAGCRPHRRRSGRGPAGGVVDVVVVGAEDRADHRADRRGRSPKRSPASIEASSITQTTLPGRGCRPVRGGRSDARSPVGTPRRHCPRLSAARAESLGEADAPVQVRRALARVPHAELDAAGRLAPRRTRPSPAAGSAS